MDTISVIVPAYNCQDTIERCIKSIQNQTYSNLEIIIVNDGSNDNTETILRELQEDDDRIIVISVTNGGVSHARNMGIDKATGDYITFVDSDDYVDEEMYEALYRLIKKYDVPIAHCSYKNVENDIITEVGNTGNLIIQNHDEAVTCLITGRLFTGGLCNKLYCIKLFESIRLDESIQMNEDILANFFLFDSVTKSIYLDKTYYYYVANDSSATHSGRVKNASEQVVIVSKKILQYSKGKPYEKEAMCRVARKSLDLYRCYLFTNKDDKRQCLKKEIKSYRKLYTRFNDKLSYYLMIWFPAIYRITYRKYDKIRKKKLDPIQQ